MADVKNSEMERDDPSLYFKGKYRILPPPLRRAAYSDRTAYVMASMAKLAYDEFEKGEETTRTLKAKLNSGGFELVKTFNSTETDTQAFLARNKDYAILAFRGTSSKRDIATDAKALKSSLVEGDIHRGFVGAYTSIMEQIKDEIKKIPGLPLYITGHSLGAALATVATQYLEKEQIQGSKAPLRDQIAACYTFGSPRVGDNFFAVKLKSPVYRVVNTTDIVTVVPLLLMGYTHVGDERFLGPNEGEIINGIPILRRIFFVFAAMFRLFIPLVSDHSSDLYREKLTVISRGRNDELFNRGDTGGKF
jgi:hypothetical protein